MSGLVDAFRAIVVRRRSTRRFDPHRAVLFQTLQSVLSHTQRAPSGFNMQGWRCLLVRSPTTKQALAAPFLGNSTKVTQAPVLALFLGLRDPYPEYIRVEERSVKAGNKQHLPSAKKQFEVAWFAQRGPCDAVALAKAAITGVLRLFWHVPTVPLSSEAYAWKQTTIAATTFMYSCAAHDLDTCPMEGFDEIAVMKILGINPGKYTIPIAFAVGYAFPDTPHVPPSYRLPPEELFFQESLDQSVEGVQPVVSSAGQQPQQGDGQQQNSQEL